MNKQLTLTQAEFDALPEWPQQKLPAAVAGNKWKYRLTPSTTLRMHTGWHIAGYEDVDGFPLIVYYDEWEIVEAGEPNE